MTRSTNMEHVEVLRDLSEVCRAAIKAGDWKVDGACDPDSLLRHADAAIASLSAPHPPAEAQPCGCGEATCTVPWEPGCGLGKSEQHAEAQAQGGGEVVDQMIGDLLPCPFCGKANQDRWPCDWLDGSGANVIRCAWCHGAAPMNVWNRRTAPPSAPVGVEGFEQWYARVDARFWNNWDACNAAFHAGKRSALAQQQLAAASAALAGQQQGGES